MRGFVWLVLVANASALAAQQRPAVQSADAVAREFFDAIQRGSFIEAARHLDTAYFHDSKRQLLESYRVPRPRTHTTADEYMKHDPDMPRAVAEYYVKRGETAESEFNELEYMYADVPDTVALKLLSTRELAARWLEARDMRYTIRKLLRSKRCPMTGDVNVNVDSVVAAMPVPGNEVLGVVPRRDTTYVLFRQVATQELVGPMMVPPQVMTLVLRDRWRVLPGEMFSVMGSAVGCGSG